MMDTFGVIVTFTSDPPDSWGDGLTVGPYDEAYAEIVAAGYRKLHHRYDPTHKRHQGTYTATVWAWEGIDDPGTEKPEEEDEPTSTPLAVWQDGAGRWIVAYCEDGINEERDTFTAPEEAAARVLQLAGFPTATPVSVTLR